MDPSSISVINQPARRAGKHQNAAAMRIQWRTEVLVFLDTGHLQHALSESHHLPSIVAHVLAAALARNDHLVGVEGAVDQPVAESEEVEVDVRQDVIWNRRLLGKAEVNLDIWVREEKVHVED